MNPVPVPQLEQDIIGAVLAEPHLYHIVSERLSADDFTHGLSQCVWRAIAEAAERGRVTPSLVESFARKVPEGTILSVWLSTVLGNAVDGGDITASSLTDVAELVATAAKRRRLEEAMAQGIKAIRDTETSPDEAASRVLELVTAAATARADRFSGSLHGFVTRAAERLANDDGKRRGIDLGIAEVTRLIGLPMPGDLIVLGAPSGAGKTAAAMQMATFVARTLPTLVVELEMDQDSIAERTLATQTGIAMSRLRGGNIDAAELDAVRDVAGSLASSKLYLSCRPRQTTTQIRAQVLGMRGRLGRLGLVVIDHNKLVRVEGKVRDRIEQIALVMDDLKALAKEAEVPIIILAQMTREGVRRITSNGFTIKDLRPNRHDLYGGGDMEEYADAIIIAHRPDMALPKVEPPAKRADDHNDWLRMVAEWAGKVELLAEKVRNGTPGRKAVMRWNGERMLYEPLTQESDYDPNWQDRRGDEH